MTKQLKATGLTILVVDTGGRGAALAEACSISPRVVRVICAPGNGGTPEGDRFDVKETDLPGLYNLVEDEKVDFVIFGPEAALAAGGVDYMQERGIPAFGPTQKASLLESSKADTKLFYTRNNIPTARFKIALTFDEAVHLIKNTGYRVIKASGLAGGKGVVVAETEEEAIAAAHDFMVNRIHGDAGEILVIEERLVGRECSFMFICDGENAIALPTAQDYKRALDDDMGLNTGGMGAVSPAPNVGEDLVAEVQKRIVEPTLRAMARAGTPFHGILYVGVMLTTTGPKVLEFNVRYGDPETEAVLPRIRSDILDYMIASCEFGGLAKLGPLKIDKLVTVCVFAVSDGYPGKFETGCWITGVKAAQEDAYVFQAGTKRKGTYLLSSGGRVLAVVAKAATYEEARKRCYRSLEEIQFKNMFYRKDIAKGL